MPIGQFSQSSRNPPSPNARLPKSADPSESPCRRSSRKKKTRAIRTRSPAVIPTAAERGNGRARRTRGSKVCDCGLASSGIPAPARSFQRGQSPLRISRRTCAWRGTIWVTRSSCRDCPEEASARPPAAPPPAGYPPGRSTFPRNSAGPKRTTRSRANTPQIRAGTGSHQRGERGLAGRRGGRDRGREGGSLGEFIQFPQALFSIVR